MHFATAKHAALAGICSTTGGDIHSAPLAGIGSTTGGDVHPVTSDSDIETAMSMEVNISCLPPTYRLCCKQTSLEATNKYHPL